jgi:hypothetical protein
MSRLIVSNYPDGTDDLDLEELFFEEGKVLRVQMRHRYAIVGMEDERRCGECNRMYRDMAWAEAQHQEG